MFWWDFVGSESVPGSCPDSWVCPIRDPHPFCAIVSLLVQGERTVNHFRMSKKLTNFSENKNIGPETRPLCKSCFASTIVLLMRWWKNTYFVLSLFLPCDIGPVKYILNLTLLISIVRLLLLSCLPHRVKVGLTRSNGYKPLCDVMLMTTIMLTMAATYHTVMTYWELC